MTSRRFMMLVMSLALLLVAGCSATDATGNAALPDDMARLLDSYEAAAIEGDPQAFVALFTEDAAQFDPHGSWSAASSLEAHMSDGFEWVDFESMIRESVLVGPESIPVTSVPFDIEGRDILSVEWFVTGMTGSSVTEKGPFSTTMTAVFDVEDGLIARSSVDFDTSEMYYPSE